MFRVTVSGGGAVVLVVVVSWCCWWGLSVGVVVDMVVVEIGVG